MELDVGNLRLYKVAEEVVMTMVRLRRHWFERFDSMYGVEGMAGMSIVEEDQVGKIQVIDGVECSVDRTTLVETFVIAGATVSCQMAQTVVWRRHQQTLEELSPKPRTRNS
jgi:hypothetical protein